MPTTKLPTAVVQHFNVPIELQEIFKREMRVIPGWPPAPGYWPIDIRVLVESGMLQKLAANPEFNKQFQVVIMPKEY